MMSQSYSYKILIINLFILTLLNNIHIILCDSVYIMMIQFKIYVFYQKGEITKLTHMWT